MAFLSPEPVTMYLLFLEMSQLTTEEDSLDWDRERGEGQPDHQEVHEQEAWCLGTVKADGCGQRLYGTQFKACLQIAQGHGSTLTATP